METSELGPPVQREAEHAGRTTITPVGPADIDPVRNRRALAPGNKSRAYRKGRGQPERFRGIPSRGLIGALAAFGEIQNQNDFDRL